MQAEIVTAAKKAAHVGLILADLYGTTTDYILGRTNTKKAK